MTEMEREYVLGTGDAELARLGFQHQVWSAHTHAAWERARFRRGAHILDIGCGPGYATFDLADLVGAEGRVLAVDVSSRFIAHLEMERSRRGIHQVETRLTDLESLTLAPSSLDGAFARWVLCFVSQPESVVKRVADALRPGGSLVVLDYCNYEGFVVAPVRPATKRVVAAVARSFRRHGGDPDVGSNVPNFMSAAGLRVDSVRPLVRSARPGSALWDWPATFFANYIGQLVEMGELGAEDGALFWEEWEERTRSPHAFLLTPPMVEVIGTKPETFVAG